jgi:hypothetical protein
MSSDAPMWKRCNSCKKEIGFGRPYFVCSVSTCNRGDTAFAFCSVECWDAHVPVLRHRESWAVEERAPSSEEWARQHATSRPPRRRVVAPPPGGSGASPGARAERPASPAAAAAPRDVLVVVSKLKAYVRAVSGMNTSDGVVDALSDRLRRLCDDAVERAREAGRRTLMDRDFR